MTNCEMCGQETELVQVEVEGIEMTVCSNCSKFGQIKKNQKVQTGSFKRLNQKSTRSEPHLEVTEIIDPDYAQKIRKTRERLSLNQEDFAQKINEKESLLHKMETSSFKPSLALARKLERILNIVLIQKVEENKFTASKTSSGALTIGDMIKRK